MQVMKMDLNDESTYTREALKAGGATDIDILVNNGGVSMRDFFKNMTLETSQRIMTLNYTSHCALTRYLIDDMLKKESGHIVMVSSISGLYPTPLRTLYASSKFGIDRFSNAVRAELSLKGVDVTVVSPSYV